MGCLGVLLLTVICGGAGGGIAWLCDATTTTIWWVSGICAFAGFVLGILIVSGGGGSGAGSALGDIAEGAGDVIGDIID